MVVQKSGNEPEGLCVLAWVEKYQILKRSPMPIGLALYYHRAEMQEAGLKATNAWGSVILPAHLYNALGEEGLIQCVWSYIDSLIEAFGEEQFFVGRRPETRYDYAKRFMLQVGI
ncbi:hypothetical protein FBEOM_5769 [Fusarium beomiforme]|uniref:Uncharacterized protein n=1 Tax=Fusarium beomiforme TaxID=44412 RepID=A0A9P5DZL6_9HYPO|nr:hypothetical protein FBEOM_5769 [Fusarium beomiforme]